MGRDLTLHTAHSMPWISIHSPRMGRDWPCGKRSGNNGISIHSPRMGRDRGKPARFPRWCDFNPLSPHGERRRMSACAANTARFQSTLPAWGETCLAAVLAACCGISIHSPRMGRDEMCAKLNELALFQSTLPACGETAVRA